ncbi:uncharacterized protein LOC111464245 [Cucurbita moschata]|uniref:Uncharacterized protein LOC111464245 n=1 Tax=Cucurbita moschata TaxID=3662 RepID=A0A6J1HJY4_CUCMO|nr:uncharacterized protein LOC111464245 [Cucurbita moschata]
MKAMAASSRPVQISHGTCFLPFSRQINTFCRPPRRLCYTNSKGLKWFGYGVCVSPPSFEVAAVAGRRERAQVSAAWDEGPYELLPNGKIQYLDEQDVVTFLDPPKELIPLDPTTYNPAAYLWKKIEVIPEERRHNLLHLLSPRCISRAWGIAGTRYDDPKLVKKMASSLLQNKDGTTLEYYNCIKSGGQIPIAWINHFKKALFSCNDGKTYGRFIGMGLAGFANSFNPLYFEVKQLKEVMSTEHPCDLAYEFGDGLFDFHEYPEGFPASVKHRYPFNDHLVVYVRFVGPGVLVGQAWQEGKALEQVPRKLCSEILMIKDYSPRPLQEKQ